MALATRTLHLHIGLPKTASTFLRTAYFLRLPSELRLSPRLGLPAVIPLARCRPVRGKVITLTPELSHRINAAYAPSNRLLADDLGADLQRHGCF